MEIINYKKIKNNLYEITFDNDTSITLYEDTIIKYNLLTNKNVEKKYLDLIVEENFKIEAYYIAIKYLSKKMRATLEVNKYLQAKGYDKTSIHNAISLLTKQGYLNDDKYLNSYINDEYNLTNHGPEKIKYNLVKLGIDESKIIINKDFTSKIKNIINKKVKLNNKLSTNELKINISNYLYNLGYNKEMFQIYLEDLNIDEEKILKKEYEKLYSKYKNKYDENKLNIFLKDKLYHKGYSIDLINKIVE